MTLILSNDDVEKLLTMGECIAVMEEAYVELADGRGVSRTRSDCFTPTARADALYSLKSMDGVAPNSHRPANAIAVATSTRRMRRKRATHRPTRTLS